MDLGLTGRTVIITGGTDGLGLATARRLVAEGADVVVCGRDEGRLDRARETLAESSAAAGAGSAHAIRADVTDAADLESLVAQTIGRFGRIDGLLNNAGRAAGGSFESMTDEDVQADFDLKVLPLVRLTRLVLPHLRKHGGSVLNSLSIVAKAPPTGSLPTSASRSAGLAYTKVLAHELAANGVRANAVLIGFIDSDQWRRVAQQRDVPYAQVSAEMATNLRIPMGRLGREEEFADVAAFLLSPRASYVTGTAVAVDGGLSPVP